MDAFYLKVKTKLVGRQALQQVLSLLLNFHFPFYSRSVLITIICISVLLSVVLVAQINVVIMIYCVQLSIWLIWTVFSFTFWFDTFCLFISVTIFVRQAIRNEVKEDKTPTCHLVYDTPHIRRDNQFVIPCQHHNVFYGEVYLSGEFDWIWFRRFEGMKKQSVFVNQPKRIRFEV